MDSPVSNNNGEAATENTSASTVNKAEGQKQGSLQESISVEEKTKGQMGCASSRQSDSSDMEQDNLSQEYNLKQSNASKIVNQPKSKTDKNSKVNRNPNDTDERMSDDDQNNSRASSRERHSTARSKLAVTFENTDDEEDSSPFSWSKRDISEYREGYPNAKQYPRMTDNYKFYTNKISSSPDGDYIDRIHAKWFGDYRKLEAHHGFIQWLFPLQEKGLNWSAEPLQKHEIDLIKKDPEALQRIIKSYRLMLDFYGFELVNSETGQIRRLPDGKYQSRFSNLNRSAHNYLRITRILKSLGEFGYEHLKFPFLESILYEIIITGNLSNCLRSCKDYWIETLKSQEERRAIRIYATELVKYRNKGLDPPPAFCAKRPTLTSQESRKAKADNLKRTKSTD